MVKSKMALKSSPGRTQKKAGGSRSSRPQGQGGSIQRRIITQGSCRDANGVPTEAFDGIKHDLSCKVAVVREGRFVLIVEDLPCGAGVSDLLGRPTAGEGTLLDAELHHLLAERRIRLRPEDW